MASNTERTDDHVGIALRLEIDPTATETLIRSPLLGLGNGEPEHIDAVYFDTLEASLRQAGFSLRIRHDGKRRFQILEATSKTTAALFVVPRWEEEIRGETPVIALPSLAGLVPGDALTRLQPAFRIKLARTAGEVQRGNARVRVEIDRGQVMDGGRAVPIDEVGIELLQGEPSFLFDLAREIDVIAPVRIGVVDQAEHGYRLIDRTAESAAGAEAIDLDARISAGAAFQQIARSCIRQFRLNDTLLVRRNAEDALHEARVGLRRLRAAMKLFRSVLADDPHYRLLRAELRWQSSELGPARNLDVLRPDIGDGGVAELVDRARVQAYDRVRTSLASPRARHLMIDLAEWVAIGPWVTRPRHPSRLDRPVVALAAAALDCAFRRVRKKGTRLADDDRLHALRIRIKALRYATDFFAPLFRRGRAGRGLAAMAETTGRLQSLLGAVTDFHARHATMAGLGLTGDDPKDHAARDARRALKKARRQMARLLAQERFWD